MRFISSEDTGKLLAQLAAGATIWAPQAEEDSAGAVFFAPWRPGAVLELERCATLSAKHVLLPATEKLFDYQYIKKTGGESIEISGGPIETGSEPIETAHIIFGARVCDAKAVKVLDALFDPTPGEAYGDYQYQARRRNLTVLTLACTSCDAACFCSAFGEGPADKSGSDVFLYPIPEGFLAEGVTEKGRKLIETDLFSGTRQAPPPLARPQKLDLGDVGLGQMASKLKKVFSDLDFWRETSAGCLSCGACAHSCPACHCFNIFDEMRSDRAGERLRSWDSCMFKLYTQEASGHNPRPEIAHRFRNRINHKFSYYPANHGEFLCTGCGRCIRNCPAGIDIRRVLKLVAAHPAAREPVQEASA